VSLLTETVQQIAEERIYCSAIQVSVRGRDMDCDLAFGELSENVPIEKNTIFNVVCATKPILALAIGILIGNQSVDPECSVAKLVDDRTSPFSSADFNLWEVLNHTAGLANPSLLEVNLCPIVGRTDLVRESMKNRKNGYSEYTFQLILAQIIEHTSGISAAEFLRREVLSPLNLTDEVRYSFNEEELIAWQPRIGYSVLGLPMSSLPLLHDRSPFIASDDRVLMGAYSSARALCQLYESVGNVLRGHTVEGLPGPETLHEMLRHVSPLSDDPVLHRPAQFAGGFMLSLSGQGYGRVSASALGHTGFNGMSWGFYDPEHEVAVAAITNGIVHTHEDLDFLRSRILASIIPV